MDLTTKEIRGRERGVVVIADYLPPNVDNEAFRVNSIQSRKVNGHIVNMPTHFCLPILVLIVDFSDVCIL